MLCALFFPEFMEGNNSVSIQANVMYGDASWGAANWTTRVEEINASFILRVVLFNKTTSLPISWT
jgi:hypothetical protein